MGGALLRFLITVAAIPLCGEYMAGVHIADLTQGLMLGAVLGLIYLVLRPLARLVMSVFNFCTLGLLNVVIDAFLVWTAAGFFQPAIQLDSIWWALAVAAVINLLRTVIDLVSGKHKH
ncbi:MAG: phage holin family protein [Candidatus Limiplasma sp.]|nr:phage holin family protein [Candidatus Limiplasma sp.]